LPAVLVVLMRCAVPHVVAVSRIKTGVELDTASRIRTESMPRAVSCTPRGAILETEGKGVLVVVSHFICAYFALAAS
jgi:hypothetical protein